MHRRQFLQYALGLPSLAQASNLSASMGEAYRAVVCIFLHGGNDAHNTVINTTPSNWSHYEACRPDASNSLGLSRASILPIDAKNDINMQSFGLHPALVNTSRLFNGGHLSVMANIGPLEERTTKHGYDSKSAQLPKKLFSHNDQQSNWQSFGPEGTSLGWAGLIADKLRHLNEQDLFTAISMVSNCVWLSGRRVQAYQSDVHGGLRVGTKLDARSVPRVYGSDVLAEHLNAILQGAPSPSWIVRDVATINRRAVLAQSILENALPDPRHKDFAVPDQWACGLSEQLSTVVRMMRAHGTLGIRRQFFFVSLYGFDTHDRQRQRHHALLTELDKGLAYFYQALSQSGLFNQVTTFTASDFGRTLTTNGDGTDHGWGGHQLVMGGSVAGSRILGDFPLLGERSRSSNEFPDCPHLLTNGVMLPTTSVHALSYQLGAWMGLNASDLRALWPKSDSDPGDLSAMFSEV